MKFGTSENRVAEAELDEVGHRLALAVEKAKALQDEAAQNPARRDDPDVELYVRWLDTFKDELEAIKTVHDEARRLSAEDLRTATRAGNRLLWAIREAAPEDVVKNDVGLPYVSGISAEQGTNQV